MSISWTPCTVKLSDLRPWADNPRMSTKKQAQRILDSWRKFGQVKTVAIGPSNEVYDGHQRLSALLTVHGPSYQIDARRCSRELSEVERRALAIALHAGAVGSWNWDNLANWDAGQLQGWGFDAETLGDWRAGVSALDAMLAADDWGEAFDGLPTEDRAPFQQMTFTLHDDQAATVRAALQAAREMGPFLETGNENGNGNALARICEVFVNGNG